MGIYLTEQTLFFLQAILLGMAFGLLYDAFRITRVAFSTVGWLVFVQDVLFFLICAVSTFFFFLRTIDGQVRFFIFVGEALGTLLYFMTFSVPVMKAGTAVVETIKALCRFIFHMILLPIWRLFYNIVQLIMRPARFLGHFLKKSAQRCKYRLKVGRTILYNQLKGAFAKKASKRKQQKKKQKHKQEQKRKKKRKRKLPDHDKEKTQP